MDTFAIIVTVFTLLGASYVLANALSHGLGFTFLPGYLLYAAAIAVSYRVGLWYNAYTAKK